MREKPANLLDKEIIKVDVFYGNWKKVAMLGKWLDHPYEDNDTTSYWNVTSIEVI